MILETLDLKCLDAGVYVIHDDLGVAYVGMSVTGVMKRIIAHQSNKKFEGGIKKVEVVWYENLNTVLDDWENRPNKQRSYSWNKERSLFKAEAKLIYLLNPRLNTMRPVYHPKEYFQKLNFLRIKDKIQERINEILSWVEDGNLSKAIADYRMLNDEYLSREEEIEFLWGTRHV